jgi:hypothetical protein
MWREAYWRNQLPHKLKSIALGGPVSVTVTLLFLLLLPPISTVIRLFVAVVLAVGWLILGIRWLIGYFGARRIVPIISIIILMMIGLIGYFIWQDEPNRQLVVRIKQLGAYYVGSTGTFLVGDVDYVYFDSDAKDEQVRQFTDLEGLNNLQRIVLKYTHISDQTARKLGKFKSLRDLYIRGAGISDSTIEDLQEALPECRIEVK